MRDFIRELRRRQVFRLTGLYVGAFWIILQVAELVLPVYDAPEWILRALISVGIVGLPIAIALAWLFDLDAHGIRRERDIDPADAAAVPIGRSKMDYVVVGVLVVALAGSLFGNFMPREPVIPVEVDPVSVLISDFENSTGDTVFDGALEQALLIAVEASTFITAFDRTSAARILDDVFDHPGLDAEGAQLVSVREGIGFVINGSLKQDGSRYALSIRAIDADSGDEIAQLSRVAGGKAEVLGTIGELALDLREALGDADTGAARDGVETFTTVSLEAMHDYVAAQRLARDGRDDEAIALYESAVASDPGFGRAWTGLALSADKLGRTDVAEAAWKQALTLLEGMSERERYRTTGVYYTVVSRDSKKAIENYEALVEKYPSDDAGYNNLAVAYFLALQFDKALAAGRRVIDIYPRRPMYHANYSLYAMYASDFETAVSAAKTTLELNPGYHKAYLPFAARALAGGDADGARTAYRDMADTGARGAALAELGIADLLLWSGEPAQAESYIVERLSDDANATNLRARATMTMLLAEAMLAQQQSADAIAQRIAAALGDAPTLANRVAAAMVYVQLGDTAAATEIAADFAGSLDVQRRAYGRMITGMLLQREGDLIGAIDTLNQGIELADLWLIRLQLGKAYLDGGYVTEAEAEFANCSRRPGEAYSVFLNDTPTFRYGRDLEDLVRRARSQLSAGAR